jgi:hypothetical protein
VLVRAAGNRGNHAISRFCSDGKGVQSRLVKPPWHARDSWARAFGWTTVRVRIAV